MLALNLFAIHAVLAEAAPAVALPADVADAPELAPPARRRYTKWCREEKVMGCKQGCKSGWKHVKTIGWGCCKSWSSCGGNRKVCEKYYECRRRNEDESEDITEDNTEFIAMMDEISGDEIGTVASSENGVADGVSEVERISPEPEVISTAEEKDTKHFVMRDGEWVQLSQVEAKGMTATVSEEADVELSDSLSEDTEDARRRWSRFPDFPGWPSGLYRCRDEMVMPCNMPCLGGWSLFVEMENACCMNGPGGIDHPKPCGFTTKVCQKFYLCWDRSG